MNQIYVVAQNEPLTAPFANIRTHSYVAYANHSNVYEFASSNIAQFKNYVAQFSLKSDGETPSDFLKLLVDASKWVVIDHHIPVIDLTPPDAVTSVDRPLLPPIMTSSDIKPKGMRCPSVRMAKCGYQPVITLTAVKEIESDSVSQGSGSDSTLDSTDSTLESKTCKRAKRMKGLIFPGSLNAHVDNREKLSGTVVHVDLLIFSLEKGICKDLADFFCLINIDELLHNSKEKDYESRLENRNAKLYRLLQTLIMRELINGAHNICVTSSVVLFKNIKANFKSLLINKASRNHFTNKLLWEWANHKVETAANPGFFHYVEAIGEIVNESLLCNATVSVNVHETKENNDKMYKVKISLICFMPFYILRYLSQKKITERCCQEKLML